MLKYFKFIKNLKYVNYNHIIWLPNKFNWEENSWYLAKCCSRYFDIWWDPIKYNWDNYSWVLAQHCSEYITKDIKNEITLLKLGA